MLSNRLALAALGVTCVAAAGAGSYLATRQNAASAPVEAQAALAPALSGESLSTAEAAVAPRRNPVERRAAPSPTPRSGATSAPARPQEPQPTWSPSAPAPTAPADPEPVAAAPDDPPAVTRDEPRGLLEPAPAPEPAVRRTEELVVSADSVIGLKLETAISSDRARVEDRVEAHVVRDVSVGGSIAIPAGTRVVGSVMLVERGGKVKERARLGIRFNTLMLADGTRLPITTETVYRMGDPPSNGSAAKIGGGAAAGAILGAIIGGAKGAAIGGTVGAGAGTAAVMAGDAKPATFDTGTDVTARILSPLRIIVEK